MKAGSSATTSDAAQRAVKRVEASVIVQCQSCGPRVDQVDKQHTTLDTTKDSRRAWRILGKESSEQGKDVSRVLHARAKQGKPPCIWPP